MADIIRLLFWILVILAAVRALDFVSKRLFMLRRLFSLRKECDAKISLHTFPLLPTLRPKEKPDITVEIFDTVYYIRLYSGISGARFVHFVDEEYSVVYSRVRAHIRPASRVAKAYISAASSAGGRVRILKEMKTQPSSKREVKILLFSPAPSEVSYVTEEKTSIKLAFTGDTLYSYKIFTPSTFATYAEREYRHRLDAAEKRRENPFDFD